MLSRIRSSLAYRAKGPASVLAVGSSGRSRTVCRLLGCRVLPRDKPTAAALHYWRNNPPCPQVMSRLDSFTAKKKLSGPIWHHHQKLAIRSCREHRMCACRPFGILAKAKICWRPDSPAGRSPAVVQIRLCPAIEGGHIADAATSRSSGR